MTPIDPRIPRRVPGFDAPFFLGGMAGYGDAPFRLLCRRMGCPFAVTESIQAAMLAQGGRGLRKVHPDVAPFSGRHTRADHPLACQLIGADPESMADGARQLVALGADVIDVNLACPAKKKKGGVAWGGRLLSTPSRALEVLLAVREAVPSEACCTVKMRRGFDDGQESEQHFLRIFEGAGDLGYAWATVHCRTVEQRYDGPGRWPFLRRLVSDFPDRLVFGSGDVWCAEDVERMREQTGVHAVSVARGAVRRPWIFQELRAKLDGHTPTAPTLGQTGTVLLELLEASMDWHGPEEAARRFRKLAFPMVGLHPRPPELRRALARCRNTRDLRDTVIEAFGLETAVGAP